MKDARLQVAFGGLHPDRVRNLFREFGAAGTLRRIMRGAIETTKRARSAVAVPAQRRRVELARAGIKVVYRGDPDYPERLAGLPDAPDLLFLRGQLENGPAVAVVGTRRCTTYGRRLAERYGSAIAAAGWSLVSGLARGIDGAAHRGTLAVGGVGVAVLGSGVDVMYPREHGALASQLVAGGGAVVSESPPGTPPEAWRFPPRNRVISGLAEALVVVEATVKGGALITAEAALRHGRDVFAVPGDVGRASSEGCNLLIRDGACPVLDPDDLIASLELVLGPATGGACAAAEEIGVVADAEQDRVVELIRAGVVAADDLLANLGESVSGGLARLGTLEMNGVIRADGPGRYRLP